jgi:hypothetical protein
MLSFPKIAKKYIVLLSSVFLITAFVVGYYLFEHYSNGNDKLGVPRETEVVKQDANIKVTVDTDLVQKLVYLKCGDKEVVRTKPADNLIGLDYQQFQKVYPGWTIEKFHTPEIEMTLQVDSFCREHANNMFVGIKDGYVTVFYGKPGSRPIVKEITKIQAGKLMSQDMEELRRGLIVRSKEELLRTLEGLQSR